MKVEFAQITGQDNGTSHNLKRALNAIAACASDTALIVFPETHLMGFPSSDTVADVSEPLDGPTVQAVQQAARARNVSVVIGMADALIGGLVLRVLLSVMGFMAGFAGAVLGALLLIWLWQTYGPK